MSSTNSSGRPAGAVSIPVEIIRDSSSTRPNSHSRQNSPFRPGLNDNSHIGFSDSPPRGSNSTSRFQPRHSPSTAYDRVITNSQFNQPYQEPQYRPAQQRMFEQNPLSRSNEDLLSSPFDSLHYSTQPQYSSLIPPSFGSGFRNESDFIQPTNFSSPHRRSFDALNDFPDMHQSFPTTRQYPSEQPQPQPQPQHHHQQQQQQPYYRSTYQTQHQPQPQPQQQQQQPPPPTYGNQTYINPNIVYTNEYGHPTDHHQQQNTFQGAGNNVASDRSRSPGSQRGASPARPSPSNSQQQQQQQQEEPELKMAKDSNGPIPMPPPASSSSNTTSSSSTQPTEPQVPPANVSVTTNVPPAQPEHARDPNTIALEKLDQIKQSLDGLEKEVDAFNGSTRHERAYKLLDEQALKIMIRCDELVDVSADIKEKRKEMIRNVQRVIDKLESKVPATPAVEQTSNPMETATTSSNQTPVNNTYEVNTDMKSSSPSSPPKEDPSMTSATEQSISA